MKIIILFHAGTQKQDNTNLCCWRKSVKFYFTFKQFKLTQEKNSMNNLKKLNWDKGFYRKDIGFKVIDK